MWTNTTHVYTGVRAYFVLCTLCVQSVSVYGSHNTGRGFLFACTQTLSNLFLLHSIELWIRNSSASLFSTYTHWHLALLCLTQDYQSKRQIEWKCSSYHHRVELLVQPFIHSLFALVYRHQWWMCVALVVLWCFGLFHDNNNNNKMTSFPNRYDLEFSFSFFFRKRARYSIWLE